MPAQLELIDLPIDPDRGGGMVVPPLRGLRGWLEGIDRQLNLMRPSTPHYRRFDATARLLTVERLRVTRDAEALEETATRLSEARRPCGYDLRDLHGVRAGPSSGRGWWRRSIGGDCWPSDAIVPSRRARRSIRGACPMIGSRS